MSIGENNDDSNFKQCYQAKTSPPPVACSGAEIVERLFLNSPRDIVFDQSARIMSKPADEQAEWYFKKLDYFLGELRGKFLDQGYPINLINQEFTRALQVDRLDLLFHNSKKKKSTVIAPLVITFSPANPNFRKWITEEIPMLHEEPKLKKLLPKIDIVTRQAQNIEQKVVNSRHLKQKATTRLTGPPPSPPGNFQFHKKKLQNMFENAKW